MWTKTVLRYNNKLIQASPGMGFIQSNQQWRTRRGIMSGAGLKDSSDLPLFCRFRFSFSMPYWLSLFKANV